MMEDPAATETADDTTATDANGSDTAKGQALAVVPYDRLTAAQQQQVAEIVKTVDINDPQGVIAYGLPAQNKIASFADTLLTDIRNKDSGYVGDALVGLLSKAKELDVDSLSGGSGLSKIPLVGNFLDAFNRFVSRYQKLSDSIERIIDQLERARMQLLKDVTVLEKMYELNLDYLKQLDLYIAAGDKLLEELNTKGLAELEAQAAVTKDPMDAQKVADFRQNVTRFERRLHDLKLSRMIAIQTAPQLRLIQSNDQSLVEKIQSSVLTTIPLWKNQIVIAITLYRQKKAAELQKEVADTTNELLAKNAELLKTSSAEVAREVERGVVDIETLRKVNADLIATVEETLRIQEEGRTRRHEAEGELARMEDELRQKLIAVQSTRG
jgi:uncharacterized protein YaaN involved in tellurite resistance